MHKAFLKTGLFFAALAVGLGAFGAHALKTYLTETSLATYETGVRYQFYHVFALLITAILYKEFPDKKNVIAGWLFIAGIILFSGSLYVLSLSKIFSEDGYKWIGAITPFGGLCFIAGWLTLFFVAGKGAMSHRLPK